jgi:hypothetical protein
VGARPIEDEGAESLCGIGACVIADSFEESHKDSLIDVESCLSQAAVLKHPRTEFPQHRPEFTSGCRSYRKWKLTLMLEEPDEHPRGLHRVVIGSTAVANALFLLDCQLACLESWKEVPCGEASGEQPIGPAGEGAQQEVDRDRLVSVEMEPVGESVDVISGGTCAEPPSSNGRI